MRKWLLVALFCTICITVTADARVLRPASRSMDSDDGDNDPETSAPSLRRTPIPPQPTSTPQPSQPSQPQAGGTPQGSDTTGAPKIYFWKQGGVLHVVSDLNDVPPRYAKQVQSADEKPTLVRAIAEGKKQGAAKSVKKGKPGKPRHRASADR